MTKSQIWVAAFIGVFGILFLIQQMTKDKGSYTAGSSYEETTTGMNQSNSGGEPDAKALIATLGCMNCHGGNLEGTQMGPALVNMKEYYNKETLIAYLRNPEGNMSAARFNDYKKKYPGGLMPGFGNRDVKELGKIADYLLER